MEAKREDILLYLDLQESLGGVIGPHEGGHGHRS